MKTEFEAIFLDIRADQIREKLNEVGAKLDYKERLMRRKLYDFKNKDLYKKSAWLRVRDEGDKVTLSYKHLKEVNKVEGLSEIEIVVDSFDRTCELLERIGMNSLTYIETKREEWILNKTKVTIETWPWVPTYLEIEGNSEKEVKETTEQLGLDWTKAQFGTNKGIYGYYFDVTAEEINTYPKIVFGEVPEEWKERKI